MSETPEETKEETKDDAPSPEEGKKLPFKERFMAFVNEYGPIAFVTWFGIFFLTWGGFILAIQFGLDVGREAADASSDAGALETSGVVGGAYLATQLTKPIRIAVTFALTPVLAAAWKRLRGDSPDEGPADDAPDDVSGKSDSAADA